MAARSIGVRWHVFEDAQAVAREAARRVLDSAHQAIGARGVFRVVLAGGRTPEQCYRLLAGSEADWARWAIYFGDERCLPPDDNERNSQMASRAWLDHVPIAAARVHSIPAERGAAEAARAYTSAVEAALPFDLVLLGMGEDGHTASLFPGRAHADGELVHAVHDAPKPPPDRVSLSAAALNDAHTVIALVTGQGKRNALDRWKAGEPLPIAAIGGRAGVDVLLDRAASG